MKKILLLGIGALAIAILSACSLNDFSTGTSTSSSSIASNQTATSSKAISPEFENALNEAKSLVGGDGISKGELYEQLIADKYTSGAAQYAVDNVGADWYAQALKRTNYYSGSVTLGYPAFYDKLIFEKFTPEQALYAIKNLQLRR